jgi:thiol-disulfide isomerase/thioredoxin
MNQPTIALLSVALAFTSLSNALAVENKAGRVAPNCAVTSLSDKQNYNLQQFKGKVVYVDFWASWCGPCVQSFPFMNSLEREFKEKGLQILAINMDESLSDAQNFLKQHAAKFTVLTDTTQQCAQALEVKAMPSSYLIDRNGVIRYEHLGFKSGETEQLQALIKQLLAETPTSR